MNTHANKAQDPKTHLAANDLSRKQIGSESTFQIVDNRPEALVQRKLQEIVNNSPQAKQTAQLQALADNYCARQQHPIQKKENNTGLPDNLKSGIENLSGYSMDDVKVHYNSDKPAQLQAHAYAQGTDIHIAPRQEKHLPHEAWHVVQQKQRRVKPTMQMKGEVNINDDERLEKEADVMGARALQKHGDKKRAFEFPIHDSPKAQRFATSQMIANSHRDGVADRCVIQAVRSVATFQGQTPGSLLTPRRTIVNIGVALGNYIDAPGTNKLNMANALLAAIGVYLGTPGRDQARRGVVQALQAEVQPEQALLAALGGPNGGLFDDLLGRIGGLANIANLTVVATRITAAYAAQLPHLVTLTGGAANLMQLDAMINHIQPQNAFQLSGLIPLAGGVANLAALDTLITNITAANAMLLFQLIPAAGGAAGLAALNALITAAGVANVNLLPGMIQNAGGAAAVPNITGAINHAHPGNGNLAEPLTGVAAGNLGRFQVLTNALPHFLQDAPPAMPAAVQVAMVAYNSAAHGGAVVPRNRYLGQANFVHFLARHTHRFFNFGGIHAANDQWPFTGLTTVTQVSNVLVAALGQIAAGGAQQNPAPGGPGWYMKPGHPLQVVAGGFTSTVATLGGGPPIGGVGSLILGQFFPMPAGGGGVIPFSAADMNAIHPLL